MIEHEKGRCRDDSGPFIILQQEEFEEYFTQIPPALE